MNVLLVLLLLAASSGEPAVTGSVYDDANGNGQRDPGEKGVAGVCVTDGAKVVMSGPDGRYRIEGAAGRYMFIVTPGERRSGSWYGPRAEVVDFPLAPTPAPAEWRFAHLSDTHLHAGNLDRIRRAFERARGVDFALVSGDLVKDALRVGEKAAREAFALYTAEISRAPFPVLSVVGNHDVFGIERQLSLVPTTHPAYGKSMYEETLGPRYYAFNRGRVHFLVLDTIGIDDTWYYGYLDSGQLAWIREEISHVPAGSSVVTVCHIPLRSGALSTEYAEDGPARTLLRVGAETSYRHVVRNARALEEILKPYRWTLALQGHSHMAERLRMWDGGAARYHTAPAVDRQSWAPWPSGIVVYTVRGDVVDDGELSVLDER